MVTHAENLDEAQTNKGFQRDTSSHVSNERITSVEECDLRSTTDKRAKVTDACHVEIKEAKPAKSLKEWLKVPGLYKVLTPEITSFTDQIALLCNYTPYDI